MFPYIPVTKKDEDEMLSVIGVNSIDDLFTDIPENLKFNRELKLPKQKSEVEIRNIFKNLANKNNSTSDSICFIGGGSYDSYIPSIVPYLASRSEFSTAYTPYQPEISQGTLRAMAPERTKGESEVLGARLGPRRSGEGRRMGDVC